MPIGFIAIGGPASSAAERKVAMESNQDKPDEGGATRPPSLASMLHFGRGRPAGETPPPEPGPPSRAQAVRVGRETKGRRGKGVTIITDLPLDDKRLAELAGQLKQKLGTGGTVRDGRIEIQGDHRDRIVAELEALGYRVKRAGG